MAPQLKVIAIVFLLLILFVITMFVKRSKISVRYSLIWYVICIILIALTLFPELLGDVTNLLKIRVASNMIFALMLVGLFVINISLTIIVSEQKEQIRNLIQELSIVKKKMKDNENKGVKNERKNTSN